MKFLLLLLLPIIFINQVVGQKLNIKKEWVGDSLEYLKLDGTHATFQFSNDYNYIDKKGYHLRK
jgi:hypothetical protein